MLCLFFHFLWYLNKMFSFTIFFSSVFRCGVFFCYFGLVCCFIFSSILFFVPISTHVDSEKYQLNKAWCYYSNVSWHTILLWLKVTIARSATLCWCSFALYKTSLSTFRTEYSHVKWHKWKRKILNDKL